MVSAVRETTLRPAMVPLFVNLLPMLRSTLLPASKAPLPSMSPGWTRT